LRSIGQAQLMMRAGMFVPATLFSANVGSRVFTHFKREEDSTMESGKFDEELRRMSAIVDHIRPHALILCNESFASTNEREGSEIAWQITRASLERRIKVFYVTHLYELTRRFHEQRGQSVVSLRAERRADGKRTFKVKEGEPLQTSFAADVYHEVFRTANTALNRLPAGIERRQTDDPNLPPAQAGGR